MTKIFTVSIRHQMENSGVRAKGISLSDETLEKSGLDWF